ncbi:hypothetical protein [Butyrivibrio sp. AE2032]|uniref:hypothetical protein n=1 Tax=Butyrivibrio sp. AE2032 TaxID=1458463 RepID=UPI0005556D53|nr:hypothetical protein [Butyrivibrio sp. AE2032]
MYEANKQCYITFYEDWIGRPCDCSYHIKSIEENGDRISIFLDDIEVVVDNHRNVQSDSKEYTIAHADKVSVFQNDKVYRIYEKTDKGIRRIENGQADYLKVKSPGYAVCMSILPW